VAHDITERKRLEKELLEISATERRRIGHELHDGLGQHLAGIAFKAKALEEILKSENSEQFRSVEEIVRLLNGAIRQSRDLARGLDPVHVEAHGLPAALEHLAHTSSDLFRMHCRFRCGAGDLRVTPETGLALYRIAQEAIRNAAVHGLAHRVNVDLDLDDTHLSLRIHDNGKGFSVGPARPTGMGLHTMRYRASSVGGVLKIESQPEKGTDVQCLVPSRSCLARPQGCEPGN
jgi:signal transduction histidine kinase